MPIGISLGKSKITPLADAVADYVTSLRQLYAYGDYFAINVSSPNTPGLRSLQDRAFLGELLGALGPVGAGKPLLVKVAPDLTDPALGELLDVCLSHGVAGIIATNTTTARPVPFAEAGGMSGRPLAARALEVVRFVAKESVFSALADAARGEPASGLGGT